MPKEAQHEERTGQEEEKMTMRLRDFHPVVRLALWKEAERRGLSVFEFLAMLESEATR